MGRPSFGPAVSVGMNSRGRSTNDAAPNTLAEAIPGMREVGRFPNTGGYSLLYDAATNEVVLFNMPVQSPKSAAPPNWKRDEGSETGIYANPDGRENQKWSPATAVKKTPVVGSDSYGARPVADRLPGSPGSAFHERTLRMLRAEEARGENNRNRARYGQAPLAGKPGHGDV
jgi:hypothetical protein